MEAEDFKKCMKQFARAYHAAGKRRPYSAKSKGQPENADEPIKRQSQMAKLAMRFCLQEFGIPIDNEPLEELS